VASTVSKKQQIMDDFMNAQIDLKYACTLFFNLITQMTGWHQQLVAHLLMNLQLVIVH